MKKVFLMAYARTNLGDDLFVKMLLERYPTCEFYMKVNNLSWLDELNKYPNLHISQGNDTDVELYKSDVNEYDAYIYIGGSIFMEGGKVYNLSEEFYDFMKRCKENNKPFCYVSSNYGPYTTQEYFDLSIRNFTDCTDICFRDKYSYNLFKDIKSVRYAPDFAFSYQLNNSKKIENSVGISVIDLSIRNDLKHNQDKYIEFLANNIKKYLELGKKVYLYSFCEYEGDERTIDAVLNEFPDNSNVIPVRYKGNIDEFLNLYSQMENMVCARFHAMILSCVAKQNLYVMSYSKKIDNVIEDLDLNLPIIHFNDIDKNTYMDLSDFVAVEDSKMRDIIKKSYEQESVIKKHLLNTNSCKTLENKD